MKRIHPVVASLIQATGTALYVAAVAFLISNASAFFGKGPSALSLAAFLMLLVLSVAVTGLLIFGKPVLLYLDGAKKQAIAMLLATIAWLFTITVIALIIVQSVSR